MSTISNFDFDKESDQEEYYGQRNSMIDSSVCSTKSL